MNTLPTPDVVAVQSVCNVGDTQTTVTLYHLIRMINNTPNTCGKLYLLNTYVASPTRIEELYCLGVINYQCKAATNDPRYSYNQRNSTWEWF